MLWWAISSLIIFTVFGALLTNYVQNTIALHTYFPGTGRGQSPSIAFDWCCIYQYRIRRTLKCLKYMTAALHKKAVQSQRWPRDTPTKVNKQSHCHPPPIVTLGWLNSTGRYGRRCWTNIFSPKFLHIPLGVDGWPIGLPRAKMLG